MRYTIVTNNPLVAARFSKSHTVAFADRDLIGVLELVRDKVHTGYRLLSHPLSGSVKPGETPYKSVMIGAEPCTLDILSVTIIEDAIASARKFRDRTAGLSEKVLGDFQMVDLTLIASAIESADTGLR